MKKLTLEEVLEGISDPRRKRSVQYPLHEVLMIMLLAVLCGATSFAKVEMFGTSKEEWLKKYMKLENGVPDACTFRNVLRVIDAQKLHEAFVDWMKGIAANIFGVVAIDGKEARRTKDAEKRPLHVVSAFSYSCGLILGQLACKEKSNEITAMPKLLEMLDIAGCIVTIDAMGTQTEIAKKIREKDADYILSVKDNQPTLHQDIQLFMDEYLQEERSKSAENYARTVEKGHGRVETRECYVCDQIEWLQGKERWKDLHGIGMIISTVESESGKSVQHHYFIYSCVGMTAQEIMLAKRAHWSIENSLHWVLDMAFREDESRTRKDNSAENFNVLRHIAYNILKLDKSVKGSLSDKQFRCLLDQSFLENLIHAWIRS